MSIYKPKNSPYFHFDFQFRGVRFCGSTGTKNHRAALKIEGRERQAATEGRRRKPTVSLNDAFGRYYEEKAQFHASAYHTDYQLENLLSGLGNATLADIGDDDITTYVARRRAEVSDSSVNREIQLLRRVFRYAKYNCKVDIGEMPDWRLHILPEPDGRDRELKAYEEAALFAALREDFQPLVAFALLSGMRLGNCIRLTWNQIDYEDGEIRFRVKSRRPGGKIHSIPITSAMRVLLANQHGNHPIYVFTYMCKRSRGNRRKGERYPYSTSGWRKCWKVALQEAGIKNFRFHDLRHTAATRVMRATGNLKVVKEMLGHADIATTSRYAHVTTKDVKDAMEKAQSRTIPKVGPIDTSNALNKRGKL